MKNRLTTRSGNASNIHNQLTAGAGNNGKSRSITFSHKGKLTLSLAQGLGLFGSLRSLSISTQGEKKISTKTNKLGGNTKHQTQKDKSNTLAVPSSNSTVAIGPGSSSYSGEDGYGMSLTNSRKRPIRSKVQKVLEERLRSLPPSGLRSVAKEMALEKLRRGGRGAEEFDPEFNTFSGASTSNSYSSSFDSDSYDSHHLTHQSSSRVLRSQQMQREHREQGRRDVETHDLMYAGHLAAVHSADSLSNVISETHTYQTQIHSNEGYGYSSSSSSIGDDMVTVSTTTQTITVPTVTAGEYEVNTVMNRDYAGQIPADELLVQNADEFFKRDLVMSVQDSSHPGLYAVADTGCGSSASSGISNRSRSRRRRSAAPELLPLGRISGLHLGNSVSNNYFESQAVQGGGPNSNSYSPDFFHSLKGANVLSSNRNGLDVSNLSENTGATSQTHTARTHTHTPAARNKSPRRRVDDELYAMI